MATELIRGLSNLPPGFAGCVATIGNFDGVHRGHQALLEEVKAKALSLKLPSVAVIFEPQPAEFFAGGKGGLARLTRLREKFSALAEAGIDKVLVLRFDQKLSNLEAKEFVAQILVQGLQVKHLIIGDDFRFGKGRQGDWDFLQTISRQSGFTVARMTSFIVAGERVSSTWIRAALAAGNLELAALLLGHAYTMKGRIAHGDKLGRKLGFPTANIFLRRKASPLKGVFVVRVHGLATKPLPGVASIGTRPTVAEGLQTLLEVHLFDFDQNIYGRNVCVEFCEKLRDEERYENMDLLREQIIKDAAAARAYFVEREELPS